MEQTMIVTTPALTGMTAMMLPTMLATMFHKEPGPAPDMVKARLMKTALKTLTASSTPALWATAVWGTKPASDLNPPFELPSLWDSSAVLAVSTRGCSEWNSPLNAAKATFLREAVRTARYGDN
jgi:hypothetical protein